MSIERSISTRAKGCKGTSEDTTGPDHIALEKRRKSRRAKADSRSESHRATDRQGENLAEIFHTRPSDIEDMIQRWLDEKSCSEVDKQWPATFCLGD
jgi:hypothetical protein